MTRSSVRRGRGRENDDKKLWRSMVSGRSCVSRAVSNELIKSRSSETAESSIIIRSLVIADQEVNGTGFSNFGEGAAAVS